MAGEIEISVVIPVYGCRGALMELYQRTKDSVSTIADSYEIIFVDDCCPQDSWEVICDICENDTSVIGIHLSRNFGQMKAITAGLDQSVGKWTVVMDCDLQDAPEDIIKLYQKAKEGYDIVYSKRKNRHDSKVKVVLSKMFYKMYSWMTDDCYDPAISNFSISRRIVIENYCKMRELHRAFIIYLKWLGFRTATIEVDHNYRKEGKSSYTMKKRITLAMDILLSQSDKVLKLIVGLGMGMAFFSFIFVIINIVRYFISDIATGWTSIMVAIFFVGGLLLMAIGCVGIYVGNIFMQSKQRPLYVVGKVINDRK